MRLKSDNTIEEVSSVFSALLSLGITAMLSADVGDRPWKQLLRNLMSYQGP